MSEHQKRAETSEEATERLDIRGGTDDEREWIRAMNLGGASGNVGAPVIISHGLRPDLQQFPAKHDALLRENPPIAHIPAQDPTPLEDHDYELAARGDQVPSRGGPGAVRRVDDRTPDSALESASRPYNLDTSAVQRGGLTGQDAAEETAEGKHEEGGVRQRAAEEARLEQERWDQQTQAAQEPVLESEPAAPEPAQPVRTPRAPRNPRPPTTG